MSTISLNTIEAFKFTKKYSGGKVPSNQKSKSQELHDLKISELSKQLSSSKNKLIQNVNELRRIEEKIDLINNSEKDLLKHFTEDDDYVFSNVTKINYSILSKIEHLTEQNRGIGLFVSQIISKYDDKELLHQFEVLYQNKISLDMDAFVKFIRAASCGMISTSEAMYIYKKLNCTCDNILVKWNFVTQLLRHKIFSLYVAKELALNGNSFITSSSAQGILKPKLLTKTMQDVPQVPGISFNSLKSSTSLSSLGNFDAKKSVHDELTELLAKSKSKQQNYSSQIANSLIALSTQVSKKGHKSAIQFVKTVSIRKIEVYIDKKAKDLVILSWLKWKDVVQMHLYEKKALQIIKYMGCAYIETALSSIFKKFIHRFFLRFKMQISWLGELEKFSSVVEIQRICRGFLARHKVMNIKHSNASIRIEKVVRGRIGRNKFRKHYIYVRGKNAVKKIELWWKSLNWARIFLKQKQQKRITTATLTLQRIVRGHYGREAFRRKAMERTKKLSAIKIQSLFRRYKAVIFVDNYAAYIKSIKAVIKIQSIFRKAVASIRVKAIRKKRNSVIVIQCMFRIIKAKSEYKKRRVKRAAQTIQRTYRGYIGRRRIKRIKHARSSAISILARIILGYNVRRKTLPVLKAYKLRRVQAALKLQARLKAIYLGRLVRKKFKEVIEATRVIQRFYYIVRDRHIAKNLLIVINNKAATKIQRVWRGILGRTRAEAIKISMKSFRKRDRLYYLLKSEYYRSQNMFHRPYVIKIQSCFRRHVARMKVSFIRSIKNALVIQRQFRGYKAMKSAKQRLKDLRALRVKRDLAIRLIQRVARGFMGRYEARKHYRANEVKWFLYEIRATGLIGRALAQFRLISFIFVVFFLLLFSFLLNSLCNLFQ
jgi:hypothetical protein